MFMISIKKQTYVQNLTSLKKMTSFYQNRFSLMA